MNYQKTADEAAQPDGGDDLSNVSEFSSCGSEVKFADLKRLKNAPSIGHGNASIAFPISRIK